VDGVGFDGGCREQTFEGIVGEGGAGGEDGFYVSRHQLDQFTRAVEQEAEDEESAGAEGEAELLVKGALPGDVDGGETGGDGDGEEAVVALEVRERSEEAASWAARSDLPVGIVAEVEDERFGFD